MLCSEREFLSECRLDRVNWQDGTLSMEPPAGVEVERMGTVLTFAELARQKAKAEKKAERRRAELGLGKKEQRGKKVKRSKKRKERRRRKS